MATKLGPHSILTTDAGLRWARRAPVVKQLDRLDLLRAAPPWAIVIFRHFWADQTEMLWLGGKNTAQIIIYGILEGFRHPNLYVEGLNETCQRLGQGLEEYVVWTRDFAAECHQHGIKVAGFSFSTGNPYIEEWQYIQREGFANVDAIAIHEYWGNQGFTKDHAIRHRWVHSLLGGDHPPFLITECGRDAIEGSAPGWQAEGISKEQYLSELRAYDQELQKDDYVLGATPFTCGPTADWWAFDMDDLADQMEGGEEPMPDTQTLAEQFPDIFVQWVAAGGDPEAEFRRHLLGIGVLPPTRDALVQLCEHGKSVFQQAKNVGVQISQDPL